MNVFKKVAKGLQVEANANRPRLMPSYRSGKPQFKDWDTERAINEGFKVSTYVYSCVYRIMKAVASVPLKVYEDGEYNPEHPLQMLLDDPHPFYSMQDIMERMAAHLYLGGNSIIQIIRLESKGGLPVELFPLNPDKVSPVPDQATFISYYEYNIGDKIERLEAKDVIHDMFTDPANPYWGMSPLQAAAMIVDTDVEAVKWNKVTMQNRAVTDGVFAFKHDLTGAQYKEAKEHVREQYSAKGRGPWVLGNEVEYIPMSLSPTEMDFIESRKMTREDICSIFQVPPPMVGIYDKATLSNIETARKIFWLDGIIPYLKDVLDTLNKSLAREFGENVEIKADTSMVKALQENLNEKVEAAYKFKQMGWSLEEINERLDLGFPRRIEDRGAVKISETYEKL